MKYTNAKTNQMKQTVHRNTNNFGCQLNHLHINVVRYLLIWKRTTTTKSSNNTNKQTNNSTLQELLSANSLNRFLVGGGTSCSHLPLRAVSLSGLLCRYIERWIFYFWYYFYEHEDKDRQLRKYCSLNT